MDRLLTRSVCPTCFSEIPAVIGEQDGMVMMAKVCHRHGLFNAFLERDVSIYNQLRYSGAPIYDGHFIDVTDRCNLKCAYCYYPCTDDSTDPTIAAIVEEAAIARAPIIMTGGEPTLRKDLPELFAALQGFSGGAGMPCNGIGLLDKSFLAECLKYAGRAIETVVSTSETVDLKPAARITLSHHKGQNEPTFNRVLENVRSLDDRIVGPIFVMKSLDELPAILAVAQSCRDCCTGFRIHVQTDLWNCNDPSQIFVSDALRALRDLAKADKKSWSWFPSSSNNVWVRAMYDGIPLAIIRWYTKSDIDLDDLSKAPTYRCRNGEIVHLTYGWIINEGIKAGWMKGIKIAHP